MPPSCGTAEGIFALLGFPWRSGALLFKRGQGFGLQSDSF
jgi:hypothetical protein